MFGHAALFLALAVGFSYSRPDPETAGLSVIIDNPQLGQASTTAKPKPKVRPKTISQPMKEAIRGSESLPVPVTPAKNDQEASAEGEGGGMPAPVAEFLVTEMPELAAEVRIPYPPGARARKAQGPVVMDLLIDDSGKVRKATLIEGPDPDLNQAALAAIKDFKFRPARIKEKAVAVRIRYTYRFVVEN